MIEDGSRPLREAQTETPAPCRGNRSGSSFARKHPAT